MREIKFRGKSTEGGWVYGSYFDSGEYGVIYSPADKTYYQCYLESIGQYTGLKDKNDSEIYEGDITRYLIDYSKHEVIYADENWYAFIFENIETKECNNLFDLSEVEVIGNIYENPELLEATK